MKHSVRDEARKEEQSYHVKVGSAKERGEENIKYIVLRWYVMKDKYIYKFETNKIQQSYIVKVGSAERRGEENITITITMSI